MFGFFFYGIVCDHWEMRNEKVVEWKYGVISWRSFSNPILFFLLHLSKTFKSVLWILWGDVFKDTNVHPSIYIIKSQITFCRTTISRNHHLVLLLCCCTSHGAKTQFRCIFINSNASLSFCTNCLYMWFWER